MTLGGWIFMSASIASVVSLCVYCFWRVLAKPTTPERLTSPLTVDTRDEDT
jgi:hypothetical protein